MPAYIDYYAIFCGMFLLKGSPCYPAKLCYIVMQIARNITTNEMANSLRYGYLKGADGRFRNPYDSGCRKNCVDFLLNGYNEDIEVPWEPIQQHGGVIQMGERYES
jgi:hypothetical protein